MPIRAKLIQKEPHLTWGRLFWAALTGAEEREVDGGRAVSVSFENQSSAPSEDRREERQPRATGPGVRVGCGAEPGAGCSLEPPSPIQLPPGGSVSTSRSAPDSGLKCSHFFCLVRAPCGLHAGLCCPRRWGAAPTPRRKGPRSRRCHRGGGGLGAGQGVCAPRTDLGAIVLLFVTGVTPSGCPWGPSRHHPSTGEPRVRQGRGAGRKGGDCPQSCT